MNRKHRMRVWVLGLAVTAYAGSASALLVNFTGNIDHHNDVVLFGFTLNADATNVRVWTDSFEDGINFDPITALWDSTGALIAENDDNPFVNPSTQTSWDSGFELPFLAAGDYFFTVASFDNFALGSNLSDGFFYDGAAPILIEDWWTMGTGYYSVWFDGVDDVSQDPIPEPATMTLLGIGLGGLVLRRARKNSAA